MKRLINLEIFLAIIFLGTLAGIILYGFLPGRAITWGPGQSSSTGLDGAAIACGLLASLSLGGIIWIEMIRFKEDK